MIPVKNKKRECILQNTTFVRYILFDFLWKIKEIHLILALKALKRPKKAKRWVKEKDRKRIARKVLTNVEEILKIYIFNIKFSKLFEKNRKITKIAWLIHKNSI